MTVVQGCLHDEYNMYALLAYMASYMSTIETASVGDYNFYVYKTTKASQEYVSNGYPVTARLIFNTFALTCAEWYRYNRQDAYLHFKAVGLMIQTLGGLKSLDPPLAELILTGDAFIAGELRLKPLWTENDFNNGEDHPMTAHVLSEVNNMLSGPVTIGLGVLSSIHREIVPAALYRTVLDLAVVLSVLRSPKAPHADNISPTLNKMHWLHLRHLAIRHRLLHLKFEDSRSEALRIALLLWMFLCFTLAGRKRSVKVIAPFLLETLSNIPARLWEDHGEIHLWILIVGTLCAQLKTKEHTWFLSELNNRLAGTYRTPQGIFHTLSISSERIFYHEPAQKLRLIATAEEIHRIRQIEDPLSLNLETNHQWRAKEP
jgi:hypothetical protein